MDSIMTYHINQPSTDFPRSVTITTVYTGTDREMNEMEDWCRKNIGYQLKTTNLIVCDEANKEM